ncbi:DUF1194 domain-containing protein [Ascidiaceihabitans sp.]|uniref:DUF1194 domain-containing protein n=1 Tax=Ascidiaceihabitans sp. TaxID=1872644 RepID=UPI003297F70D
MHWCSHLPSSLYAVAFAVLATQTIGSLAQAQCRQALALGLDVSGSVDAREYRLQLDGVAAALNASTVQAALLDTPGSHVSLLIYEWSGPADQALILPWTPIMSVTDLEDITEILQQTARRATSPGTALGDAMILGARHLSMQPECWTHTLDISGDGKSNLGARPRDVKPVLLDDDITINALVIGADAPQSGDNRQADIAGLSAYFHAEVVLGPDSFVETALGFDEYAQAMQRKLERELQTLMMSEHDLDAGTQKRDLR